jgi:thiol-disulfide isomerase/thioredoxin
MKFIPLPLLLLALVCASGCSKTKIIELPFTEHTGYGPFGSALGGLSPYPDDENNPWMKTILKTTGTPANWTDIKKGEIETNFYQSVYQNYVCGNISKELFESLKKSWGWTPDTLNLSKEPMKGRIAFAYGTDSTESVQMIVDSNNNLDFSDDSIFTPVEIKDSDNINKDSLAKSNAISVKYERLKNNKIIEVTSPLLIIHMSEFDLYMSNFPQYASVHFDGTEIAISPDNFTNLSYNSPGVAIMPDTLKPGDKIKNETVISKNEYLKIKGKIYRNIGINRNKDVLILERTNLPESQLYSTQIGYKSVLFSGTDFKTKSSISLSDYKGKYLFLDFWAVWCGPCIQEIPNLKAFYDKTDKSKIEFIGIAGDSQSKDVENLINEYSITWPQIISDTINRIKDIYGIHAYPTSYLIDPEGIIVAKDLRGKDLEDKILKLIDKQ